uniref:BEM46-like 3 n=1 Tax=Rattus norvegicus TaxID=10116 RepID=Q6IE05_RAT|nr:TPA: BEM46-like 3 [Rattus norvegicus]|eukprot:NP_001003928.1 protein ABHD12B [Rattus norvegicus]
MVLRNLRLFPCACSALGRKIAAEYRSFTSKSLKEHIVPPLMNMMIYLNCLTVKFPLLVDLKRPETKIAHTVNFFLRSEPGVLLGIWHTVPSCRGEEAKGKCRCWYKAALRDGNPIIVYLHGSAEHRSSLFYRVATNAARALEAKGGYPVDAIVLEAPFTNMWVASINYPLLKLYEIARSAYRNKDRVKMVVFPPGYHHNLLCESPMLIRSVR